MAYEDEIEDLASVSGSEDGSKHSDDDSDIEPEQYNPRSKKPNKLVEQYGSDNESEISDDEDGDDEDGEGDDDDDASIGEDGEVKKKKKTVIEIDEMEDASMYSDDAEDNDEDDVDYLQKFDENLRKNIVSDYHPEIIQRNYDEIEALCKVVRNADGVIIDPLHKSLPILTKYEKARILGERAKQLNAGCASFIELEPNMIDGYIIAMKELEQKKIPFIVERPMPNGGCEYWYLKDLEILA